MPYIQSFVTRMQKVELATRGEQSYELGGVRPDQRIVTPIGKKPSGPILATTQYLLVLVEFLSPKILLLENFVSATLFTFYFTASELECQLIIRRYLHSKERYDESRKTKIIFSQSCVSNKQNTPDLFVRDFSQKPYLLNQSELPPFLLHFWIALGWLNKQELSHVV